MNEQNAPLWRNGQTPSSGMPENGNDAEQDARERNRESEQKKRFH